MALNLKGLRGIADIVVEQSKEECNAFRTGILEAKIVAENEKSCM